MDDEHVVAIHSYNLEGSPYELKIQSGDRIRVVLKDPSGWWQGELNGVVGLFPSNFTIKAPPPSPAIKRKVLPPLPSVAAVSIPLIAQSYSTGGPTNEERASIMERIKVATSLEEVEALEKKLKAYYPSKQSIIKTWPPTAQEALSSDSPDSEPLSSPLGLSSFPPSYTYPPGFPPNYSPSQFPSNSSYAPYFSYEASPSQPMYFPPNGFTTSFPSAPYAYYARPPPTESFPRYPDSFVSSLAPSPPSPPANEWETTGSSNGVTLDCRHWLRGFCRMGAGCRFSHAGVRGSAIAGSTPSSQFSTPVCRHHLKGYCQMGAGCSFSHVDSPETPPPPGTEETKSKGFTSFSFAAKSECRLYQQGQCRLGTNCPFGHFENSVPPPPPPAATAENGWTTSEVLGTEMTE